MESSAGGRTVSCLQAGSAVTAPLSAVFTAAPAETQPLLISVFTPHRRILFCRLTQTPDVHRQKGLRNCLLPSWCRRLFCALPADRPAAPAGDTRTVTLPRLETQTLLHRTTPAEKICSCNCIHVSQFCLLGSQSIFCFFFSLFCMTIWETSTDFVQQQFTECH